MRNSSNQIHKQRSKFTWLDGSLWLKCVQEFKLPFNRNRFIDGEFEVFKQLREHHYDFHSCQVLANTISTTS